MSESIKLGRLGRPLETRDLRLKSTDDGRTSIALSASSDVALERAFGTEILDHSPESVRMGRFDRGAVPILFNHNWDDPIGMIDRGALVDGRLEVEGHLFATARGQEVAKMIEGGLRNVSIGYELREIREMPDGAGFIATDWEPYEVTIAPVPADPDVGIGRDGEKVHAVRVVRADHLPAEHADTKGANMSKENTASAAVTADDKKGHQHGERDQIQLPAGDFDPKQVERIRARSIENFCKANNIPDETRAHWITSGKNWDVISDEFLQVMQERGKSESAPALLGMSKKEVKQYSVIRAINALVANNWQKAGLELEAHRALLDRDNLQQREGQSIFVPMDVQVRAVSGRHGRRDLSVAGAPNLVGTDHLGGSFIDLLRNASVAMSMGATRLTGLRGNVSIPKLTAGATAFWLATETTAITESQQTIGQLALSPKNVAALTEISHQMLQQGDPSAEDLVLRDLAAAVGLAADVGAIAGDGTGGQPTGILNTAGIGDWGAGVSALDYSHFLTAQQQIVQANAHRLANLGYVQDAPTTVKAMTRVKFAGTASPIWNGNIIEGDCAGFSGMTSNQMPANTSLFGAWSALVLAEWGVLELAVNPQQNFAAGLTGLRAWYTMDAGLRYAGAFSKQDGIT